MDITCTPHGYHMHTTWVSHAHHMGIFLEHVSKIDLTIAAFRCDVLWSHTRYFNLKTDQGIRMSITCTSHGYQMHTTWVSYAHHMSITCAPHGYHMHTTWVCFLSRSARLISRLQHSNVMYFGVTHATTT